MSKTCPKCGGRMAQGFQLDLGDGSAKKIASWVEGTPERAWFKTVKVRGKRQLEIESWRCERCFFLESYAPPVQED